MMHRTKAAVREKNYILCQILDAIVQKELTYKEVAAAIGMTKETLEKRLVGQTEFKLIELIVIADHLGIEIII